MAPTLPLGLLLLLLPFPGAKAEAEAGIGARGGSTACDFVHETCNTVQNKIPEVPAEPISSETVESSLCGESKEAFEHLLGHALRNTSGVSYISQKFMDQITEVIVTAAARLNGTTPEDALLNAYAKGGSAHNTGYVGPDLEAIRNALSANGNIREKWALLYILTKNKYFDAVVNPIAREANETGDCSALTGMGMNATAVLDRYEEVYLTQNVLNSSLKYSEGIPDFPFEALNSWVRFSFAGPPGTWEGARQSKPSGCEETSIHSDDPSLYPPLSAYERAYQCGEAASCKLQWFPGNLCYNITEESFAERIPGYVARANALGYRYAAGPSGTTANVLQLGLLLGMTNEELVLLRLAMMAWMTPTNDHSFFEIMLGAETFMTGNFRLKMGMEDIEMLMPEDVTVLTDGGKGRTFAKSEVWSSLGEWLETDVGRTLLCNEMSEAARAQLSNLTGTHCASYQ